MAKFNINRMYIKMVSVMLLFFFCDSQAQVLEKKNVLYLNSYNTPYSWGDSIAKGVLSVFNLYPEINISVEYLDTKRYGKTLFPEKYRLFASKYSRTHFDAVIVSDNNALDFFMAYGDSLAPECPVVFCGINNPEDYELKDSRYYGVQESPMRDSVVELIDRIVPEAENIYIITDSTTTSLLNVKHFKALEEKYSASFNFKYIINPGVDSLFHLLPDIKKGDVIALFTIFKDSDGSPIHSDALVRKALDVCPVPIFIDSETMFGKGIIGGIFNSGTDQGKSAAQLAIQFLEDSTFIPEQRCSLLNNNLRFDYNALKRFNIDLDLLPSGSVIINKPRNIFNDYRNYIIISLVFFLLLDGIIVGLLVNIRRRKKAEDLVFKQIEEIQKKNTDLENANQLIKEMNYELEEVNRTLYNANSDLELAKNRAEESDHLKSAFLANLSHEIRTPMNGIMGFSSLLTSGDLDEEEISYFAENIQQSGQYLLSIIDDIIEISKLDTGQVKLIERSTDMEFLLKSIISEMHVIIPEEKDIELRLKGVNALKGLKVLVDSVKLKQVIVNLVNNAIKFTEEGFIEVGFSHRKSAMKFYIQDTGIGIDKDDFDAVFERFRQVKSDKTVFHTGSGLGLAISKSYIELMGGKIWLESEIGKGSRFYFSLPLTISEEKTQLDNKDRQDKTVLFTEQKLILVAEDEVKNFEYLRILLTKAGYQVIHAENGKKAVDIVNNGAEIDLILMDIKMPQMDGIEASRIIRQTHPDIPIVAQTAYTLEEDRERIKGSGFNAFVPKPIDRDDLLEIMTHALTKKPPSI